MKPDAPQTMLLNMNGADGDVECRIVAPSGREDDCFITPLGHGEHSVRSVVTYLQSGLEVGKPIFGQYREILAVWQLGLADMVFGSSLGWLAATVATYCQSWSINQSHPNQSHRPPVTLVLGDHSQ